MHFHLCAYLKEHQHTGNSIHVMYQLCDKYYVLLSDVLCNIVMRGPRGEELSYNINKLNNVGLNDYELKNVSYLEMFNLLINTPAPVARYFQFEFKVFPKEIMFYDLLGKKKLIYTYSI